MYAAHGNTINPLRPTSPHTPLRAAEAQMVGKMDDGQIVELQQMIIL